jgi:cysteinyl-tRNA synthetase
MLTVGGAKMAKSEGNFITVREALRRTPGEVIRLALLGTHYRDPLDWTEDRLHQARQTLDRFYRALALPGARLAANDVDDAVRNALDDDLNVPLLLSHLRELTGAINRASDDAERGRLQGALAAAGGPLGILSVTPPAAWFQPITLSLNATLEPVTLSATLVVGNTTSDTPLPMRELEVRIQERIDARALARRERRFADADRIRAELEAEGIILEDHSDRPTTWRAR